MSIKPIFKQCARLSFFSIINDYWVHKNYQNQRPIHRLFSLMRKMRAETLVIEDYDDITPLSNDSEIISEIMELEDVLGKINSTKITIFTFLAKTINTSEELVLLGDNSFLANAVLLNVDAGGNKLSYLLRAYIRKPHMSLYDYFPDQKELAPIPLINNYVHVFRKFETEIMVDSRNVHKFNIIGTFFSQQNSLTSVCAHSALKMIVNNLAYTPKLFSTNDINKFAKLVREKHNRADKQLIVLDKNEFTWILEELGYMVIEQDLLNFPKIDYVEYLHRIIESKFPCLLAFTTTSYLSHIVTVLGHTFNSDNWRGEAERVYRADMKKTFIHGSKWVDNFIIHDDNFGMYLCLPVDLLKKSSGKRDLFFKAHYSLGIIPDRIDIPGYSVEISSAEVFSKYIYDLITKRKTRKFWVYQLVNHINDRLIVIRSLIIKKEEYRNHLRGHRDFKGNRFDDGEIDWMLMSLPEIFWLCEISTPDLYTTNKTKLGDVIYETQGSITKKRDLLEKLKLLRLPGYAYRADINEEINLNVDQHYPLLRTDNTLEW